jgi:hypothetical protein
MISLVFFHLFLRHPMRFNDFPFPSSSNFTVKRKLASESREPLPFQTAQA